MHISHWKLDRAGELTDCYNRVTADWPYCHRQTPDGFVGGIADELGYLYGKKRDNFHSEMFLVAETAGRIQGFVHLGLEEKDQEKKQAKNGIIRFMAYEAGQRATGQALLDSAQEQCHQWQAQNISAFTKAYIYHFCSADGGYDSAQAHISGLFGINGYESGGHTVHMARQNLNVAEPTPPDPQVHIAVAGDAKRSSRNDVMVMAYPPGSDNAFGELYAYSLEHVQSVPQGNDQLYINWLGIDSDRQGQGWGRYLLERALWEADKIGYRHCVLGTDAGNYRAQLLYAHYDFHVTHHTHSFFKRLDN
jgi:ribosomal protein S18 acetylase RimI-like enzyme